MAEFRLFQRLPTEIRLQIWQIISIQEYPDFNLPVQIFQDCEGTCGDIGRKTACIQQWRHYKWQGHSGPYVTNPLASFRERMILKYGSVEHTGNIRHRKRTPIPITASINSESRTETFRNWVIDQSRSSRGPVCFLPSHQPLLIDWCCFINPDEFLPWIRYLKQKYPGRLEKVTELQIDDVFWFGKCGLGGQKSLIGEPVHALGEDEKDKDGHTKALLSPLLEFPALTMLHAKHFKFEYLRGNVDPMLQQQIMKVITQFMDEEGFN